MCSRDTTGLLSEVCEVNQWSRFIPIRGSAVGCDTTDGCERTDCADMAGSDTIGRSGTTDCCGSYGVGCSRSCGGCSGRCSCSWGTDGTDCGTTGSGVRGCCIRTGCVRTGVIGCSGTWGTRTGEARSGMTGCGMTGCLGACGISVLKISISD